VAGCLLIGVLHVLVVERGGGAESLRLFAMVGVLGGFTTFSSFSLETLLLVQQGALGRAAAYVMTSVVLCLAASVAGMALARAAG
jgi:CrcB protein